MKDERQTLIDLISHPAGYGVQMNGYVEIRVLECSNDIVVCEWFEGKNYEEKNYENVEEAVDSFLEIRHRRKMGLDYE